VSYDGDLNSVVRRVEVVKVDDRDGVQKVTVMGLADEYFELSYRGQGHGLTSVPKVGAVGYAFLANGRPDQAILMGLEDPNTRPKERQEGEAVMYGGNDQVVEHKANGDTILKTPNGVFHVNPPA